jgi:hypothetical protein
MLEISEKDTFAGMKLEFSSSFARRADPDATAEGAEVFKVFTASGSSFDGRFGLAGCRANSIVLPDVVDEGVRPEASVKVGTSEFGTEGISDVSVGAFDKAILVGGVRTSGVDIIFEFLK